MTNLKKLNYKIFKQLPVSTLVVVGQGKAHIYYFATPVPNMALKEVR